MHRIILYLANFSGKIESPFFATLLSLSLQQLLSSSYLKLHFKVPPVLAPTRNSVTLE